MYFKSVQVAVRKTYKDPCIKFTRFFIYKHKFYYTSMEKKQIEMSINNKLRAIIIFILSILW